MNWDDVFDVLDPNSSTLSYGQKVTAIIVGVIVVPFALIGLAMWITYLRFRK